MESFNKKSEKWGFNFVDERPIEVEQKFRAIDCSAKYKLDGDDMTSVKKQLTYTTETTMPMQAL